MKALAIDCRSINKEKTGVGNVLINILVRLKLKNIKITLFFDRDLDVYEKSLFMNLGYNIEIIKCSNYIFWEQVLLPIKLKKSFEYIWFPANTGSVFIKAKKIATIHDLIFNKSIKEIPLSGVITKDLARFYRKIFAKILAKTSIRIYTVSDYSKKDIEKVYKLDKDKIKVIYNGINSKFISESKESVVKENYILSFGSIEPRKNTKLMIKVYKQLLDEYDDMKDTKLVLYGFRGYDKSKLKELIKSLKLEDKIIVYKYIEDDDLKELYKKSKIFCFLSSFEGFGLPIIESMALRTPVIALNNSCIPEIIGESGLLIDDLNIHKIAECIHELYFDKEQYEKYVSNGIDNIKRFSWEKSAELISEDMEQLFNYE